MVSSVRTKQALRIFISAARADDVHLERLSIALAPMQRQGLIDLWSNRAILAGLNHLDETKRNLQSSHIILFLVTPHYLADAFCTETELPAIMHSINSSNKQAVPVLVTSSDWKHELFAQLLPLPRNLQPINEWKDPNKAWLAVADGIRELVQEIQKKIVYYNGTLKSRKR